MYSSQNMFISLFWLFNTPVQFFSKEQGRLKNLNDIRL